MHVFTSASTVNKKAEETSGSLVIVLAQEDEPDGLFTALSVNMVVLCRVWTEIPCICSSGDSAPGEKVTVPRKLGIVGGPQPAVRLSLTWHPTVEK